MTVSLLLFPFDYVNYFPVPLPPAMPNSQKLSALLIAAKKAVSTLSTNVERSSDVVDNAKGDLLVDHRTPDSEERAFSALEQAQTVEKDLEDTLLTARSLLDDLCLLNKQFRDGIAAYGPPKPSKEQNGHKYHVIQRCVGDGENLQNCGRWFVKVGMTIWRLSDSLPLFF